MGGEGVQAQSGVGVGVEAAADEMLQLGAQDRGLAPVGQTQQDLGVRLEGDVSTHLAKIKLAKMIRKGISRLNLVKNTNFTLYKKKYF